MRTSYTEKDPNVGHYENIGRSSGYNDGGLLGGGMIGLFMAIAFIFIVLFLIFRREGENRNPALETITPLLPHLLGNATGDEPTFVAEKNVTDKIVDSERDQRNEAEKTRELINRKFDRLDEKEWQRMLQENNALRAELRGSQTDLMTEQTTLKNARYLETKIDRVDDMLLSGRARPRTILVEENGYY